MISSTLRAVARSPRARAAADAQIACSRKLAFIFRLRPVMMLSSTLMPLNSAMFWKVRAMPHRGRLVRVHVVADLAAEGDRALLRRGRRR